MAKNAKQENDKSAEIFDVEICEDQPHNPWSDMDRLSRFSALEQLAEKTDVYEVDMRKPLRDPKAEIRRLNTRLRRTGEGGMTYMTSGVMALPVEIKVKCLDILQRDYSEGEHNPDNDPFDEYDFGTVECEGHLLFWKIDYYDLDFSYHSPDPADDNVTKRILTIMLASEY